MDARITTPPGGHAAFYDAAMWPFEWAAIGAWRRRLAAAARGRVLEIAAGTGAQFRWYSPGTEVMALEPDVSMRERARRRGRRPPHAWPWSTAAPRSYRSRTRASMPP